MWLDLLIYDSVTRFIAQLVVIVCVARLLGLVTRALGQPMVVGEIVAGIVLGPSLLGWLAPDLAGALFAPEALGALGLVSQLGLILFMFLVGLELDPRLLRGRVRAATVISQIGIIFPFGVGVLMAWHLGPRYAGENASPILFSLFFGAAMSISAFPVLARILSERRLIRSPVGALTMACAAIEHVMAWCLLAFIVAAARSKGLENAVLTTVLSGAYVAVMVWGVRPALARLASRVGNESALSQDTVAVVMLLLFLSSWATELIGVHVLLGAFLLGTIMPKEGGFAHALAEKIEDPVLILLLPAFFAYSGLRTQIGLLDTPDEWLVCGLIVFVATAAKIGASTVAARSTGLSWREAGALGVLMNTRGLMGLIVLNVGLDLGFLSPTIFTMLIITALFTTFVTTPALSVIYPPQQMARDALRSAGPACAFTPPRVDEGPGVLVCVAREESGAGLASVAGALMPDARIHALHLAPPNDRVSFHLGQVDAAGPDLGLRSLLARATELDLRVNPISFVSGAPAADIVSLAELKDVEMILLGLFRPTLQSGVVQQVIREAPCDVAVLVDRGFDRAQRVLVRAGGTPDDKLALTLARRLEQLGAEITVVQASESNRSRAVATESDLVIVGWESEENVASLGRSPSSILLVRASSTPRSSAFAMPISAQTA